MMTNTTKLMGAWGGVASLVLGVLGSFIPGAGFLGLVGSILVIVAMVRAAGELGRPGIKTSVVISIVLTIASMVVFFLIAGSAIFALIRSGQPASGAAFGPGLIGGGAVSWVVFIGASWFWYRALAELGEGSGVGLFRTAGLIYFIGTLAIIVFGLGLIAMLVGQVLQIVAFFSVPDEHQAPAAQS